MTREDLKRMERKVDALFAKVEEINQKFEQTIIVAKYANSFTPPKKKTKKEIDEESHSYIEWKIYLMSKGRQLQKQFNLVMPPHYSRVEHYLRTNNPKAFDGLKRNN